MATVDSGDMTKDLAACIYGLSKYVYILISYAIKVLVA